MDINDIHTDSAILAVLDRHLSEMLGRGYPPDVAERIQASRRSVGELMTALDGRRQTVQTHEAMPGLPLTGEAQL